jgi:hypothetical protein
MVNLFYLFAAELNSQDPSEKSVRIENNNKNKHKDITYRYEKSQIHKSYLKVNIHLQKLSINL